MTALYNSRLWLTNVIFPDGSSNGCTRLGTGEPSAVFGALTYPVGYNYDYAGRLMNMTTWTNYGSGSGARTVQWNYDPYRGFLLFKTNGDGSTGTAYTYTHAGRLASRTWARGTVATYSYDNGGEWGGVSYSDSTPAVACGYDRLGNMSEVTNGSVVGSFVYDLLGNLTSESYTSGPLDGVSITNGKDTYLRRFDNVTLHSGTALTWFTNGYDAASRLNRVSDRTNSAAYTYVGNSPLVGQILFQQSGTTRLTTTNFYDLLNRLEWVKSMPSADTNVSFAYGYNSLNERTTATDVAGNYWTYQYDGMGQLTNGDHSWWDGTLVAGQQFGYGFDSVGNRAMTLGGGDSSGANQRLSGYTVNSLNQVSSRDYPGDADIMGLAVATNTVAVNGTNAYRKWEYFREQMATNNGSAAQWMGINVTAPGQTTLSGHVFIPETPESFTYDADGNLTNDGHWNYYWDGENRLVAMINNANIASNGAFNLTFAYDYQGRRIRKTVVTNTGSLYTNVYTNEYVYDGWNLQAMLSSSLSLLNSFTWGLDLSGSLQGAGGVGGLLTENIAGNGVEFPAYDANGNVTALLNTSGIVAANYEYGPFGEVIRESGLAAASNGLRFASKLEDLETGLSYYGYRYYNPSTGKWPSRDPSEEQGGLNLYSFNANCSISKTDDVGLGDGNPVVPFQPPFTYTTVQAPDPGTCGGIHLPWIISWELGEHVHVKLGGYVIQHMEMDFREYDSKGVYIPIPSEEYWEILGYIKPNFHNTPSKNGDDVWSAPPAAKCVSGEINFLGRAYFFDNGITTYPSGFVSGKRDGPWVNAPHSSDDSWDRRKTPGSKSHISYGS